MNYINHLLENYKKGNIIKHNKLNFKGIKNFSVYNPSAQFNYQNKVYVFGRVEKREEKSNSLVILFEKVGSFWRPEFKFKSLKLEDPFIAFIDNKFILGGTEVKKIIFSRKVKFRTVFYSGKNIFSLKRFFNGPFGMKDIRLVQLNSGKIAVFTRPIGGKFKRGRIGFTIINSLNKLTIKVINEAKIIQIPLSEYEWGGVNDIIIINENLLGILAHFACFRGKFKEKFYYPISFCFDVHEKKAFDFKILFTRADLPFGESKDSFLYNVIFPGGIMKHGNFKISVGVGDCEAYEIILKNPFNAQISKTLKK